MAKEKKYEKVSQLKPAFYYITVFMLGTLWLIDITLILIPDPFLLYLHKISIFFVWPAYFILCYFGFRDVHYVEVKE